VIKPIKPMCRSSMRCLIALVCLLAPGLAAAAPLLPGAACPASRIGPLVLPHVRAALARNHELVIVAFGSSSTVSWMASDIGHSYPAVLQDELGARLPAAHVAVINRGVGGQDVSQEVARLATDVLPIRPQLVIWQVGANDVLRDENPLLFARKLRQGVLDLQAAGIDVVLMDNQRSPRIMAVSEDDTIDGELAQVAGQTGADLFARSAVMDQWRAEGYPYAAFVAADRLHHNDRGYRCIADALVQSITAGLAQRGPRDLVQARRS
jgi:lysophospholipase L1-like esterase